MTQLPNLGAHTNGAHISQSQSQKEVTSNELDDLLDNSANAWTDIVLDDGIVPFTVPTDTYLENGLLILSADAGSPGLSGAFTVVLPATARRLMIWNRAGFTATIEPGGSPNSNITIADGIVALCHNLGDAVIKVT